MTTVIRFENVSKRYNLGLTRTSLPSIITQRLKRRSNHSREKYLWSLKDVSFDLAKGESLALIGPNGAGKSTILKLLANITIPTSGKIKVNGKLSALIELGAGFHPDLTGRENIYLNGTILGLTRREIDKRFDEIVDFAELDQFIETPVKRYSSGMTVRLGFAVAACIEPDILLVDEVLAVGDASFRLKCVQRIKELLHNGTSLIFVSHDLGLVRSVCESAIYIEHGQVQLLGRSSEVIEAYTREIDKKRAIQMAQAHRNLMDSEADIEIAKIEVSGEGDPELEGIANDKPAIIRVHYYAYRHIEKANLFVRINRSDDVSCCILRTSLDHFDLSIKPGPGVVSVLLEPLQLYGGMYYAIAWVMDAEDAVGICRGISNWFRVKNLVPGREINDAVFEPQRRWQHDTISPIILDIPEEII